MGVRDTLIKKLKIKNEELGCSTGSKWFGTGDVINSFSPVDGESIGKIKTASEKDLPFEKAAENDFHFRQLQKRAST